MHHPVQIGTQMRRPRACPSLLESHFEHLKIESLNENVDDIAILSEFSTVKIEKLQQWNQTDIIFWNVKTLAWQQ